MKSEVVKLLDTLADYYTVANDSPRVRSFRVSARHIELLPEVSIDIIKKSELGKSTKETIEEFLATGKSLRLDELKDKYPPIQALDLLQLYNFDLQFVLELWQKYRVSTLAHLYSIRTTESRVNKAIEALSSLDMNFIKLPEAAMPLLGDVAVHSAYGTGMLTIEQIATIYKERDYKHGFIADYFTSPNVLGAIGVDRVYSQRKAIKEAQIKYDIKIWQGLIVDADLQGNVPSGVPQVDYYILKLSTAPHENSLSRLQKASTQLNGPVLIDVLDRYCHRLDKRHFIELSEKWPMIMYIPDYITSTRILTYLTDVPTFRTALVSYSRNDAAFDEIFLAQDLAHRLGIAQDKVINCLPSPFSNGPLYSSTVGVRQKDALSPEDSLKRLEATFQKIQQLQSGKNHLGHLFRKDKK